jgi:multidrug transporter EmrE-like cation transporter
MSLNSLLLVITSVSLSAIAQMSFKHGMNQLQIDQQANLLVKVVSILFSPFVFGGLALYGVGTILWLFALKQLDLSLAYPFVGLSFVMVFALSIFVLGEPLHLNRLIGSLIIVVGIIFLAKG